MSRRLTQVVRQLTQGDNFPTLSPSFKKEEFPGKEIFDTTDQAKVGKAAQSAYVAPATDITKLKGHVPHPDGLFDIEKVEKQVEQLVTSTLEPFVNGGMQGAVFVLREFWMMSQDEVLDTGKRLVFLICYADA